MKWLALAAVLMTSCAKHEPDVEVQPAIPKTHHEIVLESHIKELQAANAELEKRIDRLEHLPEAIQKHFKNAEGMARLMSNDNAIQSTVGFGDFNETYRKYLDRYYYKNVHRRR